MKSGNLWRKVSFSWTADASFRLLCNHPSTCPQFALSNTNFQLMIRFNEVDWRLQQPRVTCLPDLRVCSGTTRREASDQGWSGVLNPKWPRPQSCKGSCSWSTTTPTCSPGRSETGWCWSECVMMTTCPASARSTGTSYPVRVCVTSQICKKKKRLSVFTGSSGTKSGVGLVKLVSIFLLILLSPEEFSSS